MKSVSIVSPRRSGGARALVSALRDLGVAATRTATPATTANNLNVGWGIGSVDGLNKKLPNNKLWELEVCAAAGVRTVPFSTDPLGLVEGLWFRRKLHHTKGRDIVAVRINGR
jgi:hypothetical protein